MNTGIQLFHTPLTACSYLDDRQSANILVDPSYQLSSQLYEFLLQKGFRRSADMVYRPACPNCQQCKSTRVPVNAFLPNRSQKRAWNRVQDKLLIQEKPATFSQSHFDLYKRYTGSRHHDSDMAESDINEYMSFLTASWSETVFLEIMLEGDLLAVAVTDKQPHSLSAVYTFFDPDKLRLSPGVVAILSQIKLAQKYQLDWLYLGYWINDCQKMAYKVNFNPIQIMDSGSWRYLDK